jgi:hypothetical protein
MSENVELSTLEMRYEGHRIRDKDREARLLVSIAERGIEEPLEGVDTPEGRFLLNGFKRYRCAAKLGIDCVPYDSLGEQEATGIVSLMRVATDNNLGILEQARFVVDLLTIHDMSVADVAETLARSKAWISMRRNLPNSDVKNERFSPEGQPAPRHRPKNRKQSSQQEEQRLRAMDPAVGAYLDYALAMKGIRRHQFVRDLFALSRKVTARVFVEALERAQRYGIVQLATLQKIAWFCLSQENQPLPEADIDDDYRDRPEYQEGCLTDEPDLSMYEPMDSEDESENDDE